MGYPTRRLVLVPALAALLSACAQEPALPPEETLGRFPLSRFHIERDRFLPANDPAVVAASEAAFLRDEDEVFGLVVRGKARAYPISALAYHHVVNDRLEGVPVAVTY